MYMETLQGGRRPVDPNEQMRLAGLTIDTTRKRINDQAVSPHSGVDSQLPGVGFQNSQIVHQSMAELSVNIPQVHLRGHDGTYGEATVVPDHTASKGELVGL
jgi:hypothetical protein